MPDKRHYVDKRALASILSQPSCSMECPKERFFFTEVAESKRQVLDDDAFHLQAGIAASEQIIVSGQESIDRHQSVRIVFRNDPVDQDSCVKKQGCHRSPQLSP